MHLHSETGRNCRCAEDLTWGSAGHGAGSTSGGFRAPLSVKRGTAHRGGGAMEPRRSYFGSDPPPVTFRHAHLSGSKN
jgi:hypothetical protein